MNGNQKQRMNIFFYSKFSTMCTDLLKMMDSYGVINQFLLKCIDDMDVSHLPPGLERVPTLIVIGIDKPLVAKEAVDWFNGMRPIFMQQKADMQNKKIMFNIMKNNVQMANGPKAFSQSEYSGLSDSFAYTDVDLAQPKAFCGYNDDKDVIFTPPDENTKIQKDEQERKIREYEQIRKRQESDYNTIMRQGQIDAIMNAEKEKLLREKLGI